MKTKTMKFKFAIGAMLLFVGGISAQIGSPGWVYDSTGKVNAFYEPKQKEWAKAGVTGGIRNPSGNSNSVVVGDNTAAIQTKLTFRSNNGGGTVKFPAGIFLITQRLNVPKNVVLEGVGHTTVLKDNLSTNNSATSGVVIQFESLTAANGHQVGGIRNLKIEGALSGTPNRSLWSNEKPNIDNIMVSFLRSENLFLDNVQIVNSGSSCFSTYNSDGKGHHTLRNCTFDGAWNKGGGGEGYLNISSGYCLITKCTIKNLRHFALQQSGAKYNVVYDNIINQDVNFHNDDSGNNLIEKNKITIDSGIVNAGGASRYVVMGPWSIQHTPSRTDNYVYNNTVVEAGRTARCNNKALVYKGAKIYEANVVSKPNGNPFAPSENIGTGKRMYSVKNGSSHNKTVSDLKSEELTNDLMAIRELKVYPNPVSSEGVLNVELPSTIVNPIVRVVSLEGKVLYKAANAGEVVAIDLNVNKNALGVYIVEVQGENESLKTKIIIK